ncbi:hypothetical protein GCM10023189_28810 [Nibrella saemangeumensis]|uniref:Tetratricopeptide repeat-containing protein n=1 Tax=Nibrella saemangeumensis TaxID=1084526 RepID=A0ABP8MZ07_9BACT
MQPLDKETFSYWVTHPDDLTVTDFRLLQESLEAYPYCQSLHTLTAKAASLHQKGHTITFVRQAAAHALSRNALRKLIDNEFQWSDNLLSKLNELSQRHVPIPEDYQQESYALFKSKSGAGLKDSFPRLPLLQFAEPVFTKEAEPAEPVPIVDESTLTETALQNDLEQSAPEPAPVEEVPAADPVLAVQKEIIEMFIKNEPRITPIRSKLEEQPEQEDLTRRNQGTLDGLATESLAKIMLKQGKTGKAIEIYEKLMLKNPEKSAYFAAKISELKESQALSKK